MNRNKKSVTLNLKSEKGQSILKRLVQQSDVLIENFKPGTMKKIGLDYDTLKKENAGLIYCSITGYGQNGPYRDRPGYDFMIQAQGGIMSITGPARSPGRQRSGQPYTGPHWHWGISIMTGILTWWSPVWALPTGLTGI